MAKTASKTTEQVPVATPKSQRILIVGGSGEGKSSLINLLAAENLAVVSSGARGCTLKCEEFSIRHGDLDYFVFDTIGFNEPTDGGKVSHKDAIKSLVHFAKDHKDGFNLIVFVMRKNRITKTFKDTYEFFYEVLLNKEVPCILYVSGSEHDDDMSGWYKYNKQHFDQTFNFVEGVSGTSLTHTNPLLEAFLLPKRMETRKNMWEAIQHHARPVPFGITTDINAWLHAFNYLYYYFSFGGAFFKSTVKRDLEKQLRSMSYDEPTIRDIMQFIS
jgi:predicted GTPase